MFMKFEDDLPIFGCIKDIIIVNCECLFILIPYVGHTFSTHYNAYEVSCELTNYVVYKQENLIDHHTLTLNNSFVTSCHRTYICVKYHEF